MSRPRYNKLNQLLKKWPNGVVATLPWLNQYGIYKQLIKKYCHSGWVTKIGQGAYTKLGDHVNWQGGLYAIQQEAELRIHVGGLTALEHSGFAHYILSAASKSRIFLFCSYGYEKKLPRWFLGHFGKLNNFVFVAHRVFNPDDGVGIRQKEWSGIVLNISEPERAILEVLKLVPKLETYEHANYLMQGLQMLRPALIQQLLERCTSIKVKRLFMHLAEKNNLPCLEHIDFSSINLGKGKRVIGQGGVFDSKYNLSVPKLFEEESKDFDNNV